MTNKSDTIDIPEFEFERNDRVAYRGSVQIVDEIVYRKKYDRWFYKINQSYITRGSLEERFELIRPNEVGDGL